MIEESNGNNLVIGKSTNSELVASPSTDDLSQSLSISEYTDADESMSAPTEFLAEVCLALLNRILLLLKICVCFQFLSAVMSKDYKNALKYCNLSKFLFTH